MITLGICGGMGSGKSYVCRFMVLYGVPVYISDIQTKLLLIGDKDLRQELIDMLGDRCYDQAGKWDTKHVMKLQDEAETTLDSIGRVIEPYLIRSIQKWREQIESPCRAYTKICAIESALFEKSKALRDEIDIVFNVVTPLDVRVRRIKNRDSHRTDREIITLLYNQLPGKDTDDWRAKPIYSVDNGDDDDVDSEIEKKLDEINGKETPTK